MDQHTKITIISDLLSKEEIETAFLNMDEVTFVSLTSEERLRGSLDPEVLAAIINSSVVMASPILMLIINKIIEKFREKKKDGLLIIKNEKSEVHIPFVATEEEIKKKLELVKTLKNVEHLMITSAKDE